MQNALGEGADDDEVRMSESDHTLLRDTTAAKELA